MAREFSAVIGLATIFVLFGLAYAITHRTMFALAVALLAGLSPYLFEVSRLVFEVALDPVLIALFLLVLYRAGTRTWRCRESVVLALLLGLQMYSYQSGRVFAPFFFLGVLIFYRRAGARRLIELTVAYVVTLIPLAVYSFVHPGVLALRLHAVTWYRPHMTVGTVVWQFIRHYLDNLNPWGWAALGDPEPRDHLPGVGSFFWIEVGLAVAGLVIVLLRKRGEPWWRFVVFAVFASPIAAAPTFGAYESLRDITLPVVVPLLAIPAIEAACAVSWPRVRVALGGVLVAIFAFEAVHWQVIYRDDGPDRGYWFEAPIQPVINAAFKHGGPVYALRSEHAPYIDILWFGVLDKRKPSLDITLPGGVSAPPGALMIGATNECATCKKLKTSGDFQAYFTAR